MAVILRCYLFGFTEEVYQKSSALHSFEKLYSQAMQLQVQVEHDLWGLLWPLPPTLGLADQASPALWCWTWLLTQRPTLWGTDAHKWLVRACLTRFAVCLVGFLTTVVGLVWYHLTNQLWYSSLLFLKMWVFSYQWVLGDSARIMIELGERDFDAFHFWKLCRMWHPLCKRKKNWNCISTFCHYLYGSYFVNNVNIYYIFYGCSGVLGPFLKGGGVFGLMRHYVHFVWWNFILQYPLFFVTSAGFVFNMYTYQVWILSLECAEWFFVTINVWLKKPVNVWPWAINQNTCILLPLRFSRFQIQCTLKW